MGFKRKMYDTLKAWKTESNGKTAAMIDGARRVGKSYIAEEFARREYRSYILIDFNLKIAVGVNNASARQPKLAG